MLEFATSSHASAWTVVRELTSEMSVGLVVGAASGAALVPLLRRVRLPNPALYPLRTLAAAGIVYGLASVSHGSGFLAVFVAGIVLGDTRIPFREDVERFHTTLANLGEIVVFVALGITVDVTDLGSHDVWLHGLVLAVVLAFVARPLVVGALLAPARLRTGERLFVMWAGLKGAVPILLAAFVLLAQVDEAARIYGIVFVVVAFSVVLQGMTIAAAAARLGVPMRRLDEPEAPGTVACGGDTGVPDGGAGRGRPAGVGQDRLRGRAGARACER
jgi:cell volume regulation protein A